MKAAAFSGGGRKGAFQAGMLFEIAERDALPEYLVLGGTSVGAIAAAHLAAAPMGALKTAVETYADFWLALSGNEAVYEHWFLIRELAGILYRDAFYDSTPLQDYLKKNVDQAGIQSSGRKLRINAVGYGSGEHRVIDETEDDLWQWVVASSAFPGFLLPMRRDDELWIDGGVRVMTPLKALIEAGATDIDVFLASPLKQKGMNPNDNEAGTDVTGLSVALRALDLMTHELFLRDIKDCLRCNRLVAAGLEPDKKHIDLRVFAPTQHVDNSLDFDPSVTRELFDHGRAIIKGMDL